ALRRQPGAALARHRRGHRGGARPGRRAGGDRPEQHHGPRRAHGRLQLLRHRRRRGGHRHRLVPPRSWPRPPLRPQAAPGCRRSRRV
ncbi:MAG: hypothetical protein AVDCRST_MAG19-1830, partial [uncultured Thermomicrobiales bacterium]